MFQYLRHSKSVWLPAILVPGPGILYALRRKTRFQAVPSHQLAWKCTDPLSKRKVVFLQGSVHFHVSWRLKESSKSFGCKMLRFNHTAPRLGTCPALCQDWFDWMLPEAWHLGAHSSWHVCSQLKAIRSLPRSACFRWFRAAFREVPNCWG